MAYLPDRARTPRSHANHWSEKWLKSEDMRDLSACHPGGSTTIYHWMKGVGRKEVVRRTSQRGLSGPFNARKKVLCCMKNPLSKQVKLGSTVSLSLDQLEASNLAFSLALAPN